LGGREVCPKGYRQRSGVGKKGEKVRRGVQVIGGKGEKNHNALKAVSTTNGRVITEIWSEVDEVGGGMI